MIVPTEEELRTKDIFVSGYTAVVRYRVSSITLVDIRNHLD